MKAKNYKKLLKEKNPKEIIRLYCNNKIFLNSKQLDEIIKLKNEGEKNEISN